MSISVKWHGFLQYHRMFLELVNVTKHTLHCVPWSSMSVIWWRSSKVRDSFYLCAFCDSSLWLEKWQNFSVSWWWPNNRLWCFRRKAYLKSDTVVELTRLSLKRYKIHVCLRNFNYEISVDLNLAPCTITGCCHIDPVNGIEALRSF